MPAVAAAVILLAGGGAWFVLSGGTSAAGNPSPADTTARQPENATTLAHRESTSRAIRPPPPVPVAPVGAIAVYDDAAGRRALDRLVDQMDNLAGEVLVDSAKAIYRASRQPPAKANAAYITAQFYLNGNGVRDLRAAREWIVTALQHDAANKTYRDLKSAIERDLGQP